MLLFNLLVYLAILIHNIKHHHVSQEHQSWRSDTLHTIKHFAAHQNMLWGAALDLLVRSKAAYGRDRNGSINTNYFRFLVRVASPVAEAAVISGSTYTRHLADKRKIQSSWLRNVLAGTTTGSVREKQSTPT